MEVISTRVYELTHNCNVGRKETLQAISLFAGALGRLDSLEPREKALMDVKAVELFNIDIHSLRNSFAHRNYRINFSHHGSTFKMDIPLSNGAASTITGVDVPQFNICYWTIKNWKQSSEAVDAHFTLRYVEFFVKAVTLLDYFEFLLWYGLVIHLTYDPY